MITDISRPSDKDLSRLASLLGDRATLNEPIGPYTTYRVGGEASIFMRILSVEDLHALSRALSKVRVPVIVLGRGSNMLVSDSGFRGVAITLGPFAEQISLPQINEQPILIAGSMASLPVLARQSVHHGLTGFEWAVGVPGSLGGAVRMNAGGHGADMIASVISVRLFHIDRGIEANVSAANLGLRFRGSDLTDQHVVLSATLRLSWGDSAQGEARMTEIVKWRRDHQPGGQNAGSVFVNPVAGATSAGALIDGLGLRGYRIGSASISDKHANFIQADEDGSADDVAEVMTFIRDRVSETHGIDLRSEIRLVGFSSAVAVDAGAQSLFEQKHDSQLDAAFGTSADTDLSIPMPTFSEQLSDDVMAELHDAFTGDLTPISNLRVVRPDVHTSERASELANESVNELVNELASESSVSSLSLKTNDGRIVIVDEELRLPTDSDFPVDEQTSSVHIAPTSNSGTIIEDSRWASRRKVVATNASRNKKRLLVLAGSVFGVIACVLVVLASPIVGVRKIDVEGVRYMNADLVTSVKKSLLGKSVLTVDTNAAERRLEGDPWVDSVRIRTYFPTRLTIEIVERVPVAWFIGVDNRARIVDQDARVLAVETGQPTAYLQITGVGANLAPGGSAGDIYRAAAQLAKALPDELMKVVLNVGTAGPNQLTMTLRSGTLVNFGQPVDVQKKLIALVVLLRRQDSKQIISIDLTNTDVPTVKSK